MTPKPLQLDAATLKKLAEAYCVENKLLVDEGDALVLGTGNPLDEVETTKDFAAWLAKFLERRRATEPVERGCKRYIYECPKGKELDSMDVPEGEFVPPVIICWDHGTEMKLLEDPLKI